MQLVAKRAVDDRIDFFGVGKHEGEVVHDKVLHLRRENAGVEDDDLKRAALQRADIGRIATQGAAWEDVDLELAARARANQLGKLVCASGQWVALGVLQGQFERALAHLLRIGHAQRSKGQRSYRSF